MKIHILGICGTFMGGIALLARALGHEVSGSDANVYPPMSTQLEGSGIRLHQGYSAASLQPAPDMVIVGNVVSRGNPCVEYLLDRGLRYTSGPQWLSEQVLADKHVLAVSGTHGKTTTTSLLAWILDTAGQNPGFLIGGMAENFGLSARLGDSRYFVVEADEYDTAFFDKRSKFIHYHPRTLIINNIEFDHADIFHDIADIKREFHRLIRILPATGRILHRFGDPQIQDVLAQGCWTPCQTFGINEGDWHLTDNSVDFSQFDVIFGEKRIGTVGWKLIGRHNAENALAAIAAAHHVGISPDLAAGALATFKSVKRRLEKLAEVAGITIYDDFAHHPTAIAVTLAALRTMTREGERVIALFEPRSNTMKLGIHRETLAPAFEAADKVYIYQPRGLSWDMAASLSGLGAKCKIYADTAGIIDSVQKQARSGDHVVIMSNGGFEGIHRRLIEALEK